MINPTPSPISDQAAGEPAKLAKDLEDEQTYLASCRDMCSQDDELPRWDRLQRAIDYFRALSTGTEHSAIYISKRLTGSDADASFVQAHINQAVSEAMEAASPAASVLTDAQVGRNLEGLREQLLAPRGIVRNPEGWPVHAGARDSSGWLFHPALPVCDEGTRIDKLLEAFGIETSFVPMESDAADFYDRWGEEGLCDCSSWVPTPPTGDGWLLLEIYDTEDGPCALFGRDWYEAEKVRKQAERAERRAALLAASMGGNKS